MAVDNCLLALKQARFGLKDEEALELIDDLRSQKKHLMNFLKLQVDLVYLASNGLYRS